MQSFLQTVAFFVLGYPYPTL